MTPSLAESYARCRALHRQASRGTWALVGLLPSVQRPHVHALAAFVAAADGAAADATARRRLAAGLDEALAAGDSGDPMLRAVARTARAFGIDGERLTRVVDGAAAAAHPPATVPTHAALVALVDGRGAARAELVAPVLDPRDPAATAHLADLGRAVALTAVLGRVGADLERGCVLLPEDDLRRFGADPRQRAVTPQWEALLRVEVSRVRRLLVSADVAAGLLPAGSARVVRVVRALTAARLRAIERAGYDVLTGPPHPRPLAAAAAVAGALRPPPPRTRTPWAARAARTADR